MVSELREHLGKLLKGYIKRANIKQIDIAAALDLSPSAVSQMLSGRVCLNLKQLEVVMEMLALDRNDCAELRDCLTRIKSGDDHLRSPLNDFIKSARIKCGISMEQLSQMSGIALEDLYMLENRLNVQPTPYEAVRLAAIFNCDVSDLWQSAPNNPAMEVRAPVETVRGISILRDESEPYRASGSGAIKIPVICIDDLCCFNGTQDRLIDFAWRHMRGVVPGHEVGMVIVKAAGDQLGWSEFYDVDIRITDGKCWLPGMSVICRCNGELCLAQAMEESMQVQAMDTGNVFTCDHYWMICGLSFNSELFAVNQQESIRNTRGNFNSPCCRISARKKSSKDK